MKYENLLLFRKDYQDKSLKPIMNRLLEGMELKTGRSLNMLDDKEKWLVFGNLEIRITPRVERDFRTLRGTLTSKKSAVDIVRKMRENDREQEARL